MKKKPSLGLIREDNFFLNQDYYELSCSRVDYEMKKDIPVVHSLFFRRIPQGLGSYVLNAGLEQAVAAILKISEGPSEEDIEFLLDSPGNDMPEDYLAYLCNESGFKGDIWGIPEGIPVFPNEPLLLVSNTAVWNTLYETAVLSVYNHHLYTATISSRVRYSAGRRSFIDFGSRRAHSWMAGLHGARAAYIGGADATSNVLAGKMFGIPYTGTMHHSFVQSRAEPDKPFYESELEAFLDYATVYPHNDLPLVDTYNSLSGTMNAISVGRKLREETEHELRGIRLDSGDQAKLSKQVSELLINAGMGNVRVYSSDGFDEFKITKTQEAGGKIDGYGVGTSLHMGRKSLGAVYKLVEANGHPVMKFTNDKFKRTLPGKQQVWRVIDPQNQYHEDWISTWDETLSGEYVEPLLIEIVRKGEVVYDFPSVREIKTRAEKELKRLKRGYRMIKPSGDVHIKYPIGLSPKLEILQTEMLAKYNREYNQPRDTSVDEAESLDEIVKMIDTRDRLTETMKWLHVNKW